MNRMHMWHRMAYMGFIIVKCGRKVRATQFTDQPEKVTCKACLNRMGGAAMKTHYDPHPHGEESEEHAVCGTWLGDESNLSGDWARVDCRRCLNGKGKITASIADEERFIVEQMGHMAAHMREKH